METYKVLCTLHSDIRLPEIWVYQKYNTRLVKVSNSSGDSIIVVARRIENKYEKTYNSSDRKHKISENENPIVISEYYRNKLNISKTLKDYSLIIKKVPNYYFYSQCRFLATHADDAIRLAFWISFTSIFISLLPYIIKFINFIICIIDNLCTCN